MNKRYSCDTRGGGVGYVPEVPLLDPPIMMVLQIVDVIFFMKQPSGLSIMKSSLDSPKITRTQS